MNNGYICKNEDQVTITDAEWKGFSELDNLFAMIHCVSYGKELMALTEK